jgi:hypothetical protein
MSFSILSGRIDITEPGKPAREYERFILTINPDESRTLRTLTRSPKGDLLRDVNQLVDKDFRPIEAIGRLFFKGQAHGTVLRRVHNDKLQSWVWTRDMESPDYAEFDAPPRMTVGFHPIFHDAWKMNFHETSHADLQEVFTHTVSNTWNGSSLSHGQKIRGKARFDGQEDVEVPAGRFPCERFYWHTTFGKDIIVWRSGPHHLFVKLLVAKGDKEGTVYELAQFEQTDVTAQP